MSLDLDLLLFRYIDFRLAGNNIAALACKHDYISKQHGIEIPFRCAECGLESEHGDAFPADETGELLWLCENCIKNKFVKQHTIFGGG